MNRYDSNEAGERGEGIFKLGITQAVPKWNGPLFRATFLGEKKELVDYLLELNHVSRPAYCFVQVKSTDKRIATRAQRLPIWICKAELTKLARFPAPTYLVGVDLHTEMAYIISANEERRKDLSGIPTRHPLNQSNIERLWHEVRDTWHSRQSQMRLRNSTFRIKNLSSREPSHGARVRGTAKVH